jgi:DUF4097 and DUF4098 domain-containing protein YvlB
MKIKHLASLWFLTASGCLVSSAAETLLTKRESFAAAGVTNARIEAGAGHLTITGRQGASTIEVVADYRGNAASEQKKQEIIDGLRLSMEVRNGVFHLKSENVQTSNWTNHGWIDLNITLPAALSLNVDDGSGAMSVIGIDGDVTIHDGSGEIEAERIVGILSIEDGSGSIRVRDVGRDLRIRDGSGGIRVEHVGGDVQIHDGSGSINVVDVTGSLVVPEHGSGSIHHEQVRGRVQVPARRGRS